MLNYTKPLDHQITPALESFFSFESSQCLCVKMPSYQDGWVIQGLGTVPVSPYILDSDYQQITPINEPSLAFPILCALWVKWISDWLVS